VIYFDLDGVLAKYDYGMYAKKNPAWNEVGAHAFRNIQADDFMQHVVIRLFESMDSEIYILTSVYDKDVAVRNEQIMDKMLWVSERYPIISLCNFIACGSDKRNAISKIKGMRLARQDILIDDYKKNLVSWASAGGTAIKYVNGINSVGDWPGPYIDKSMSVDEAVGIIMDCWYRSL
jgi:5'(3')-deoxyribonucleotidase